MINSQSVQYPGACFGLDGWEGEYRQLHTGQLDFELS